VILLKKIEDLNSELSKDKEKITDLLKENNFYKDNILHSDQEIKFLKKE